ncbi:MAG: hypothetical protein J0L88_03565 [Xanthomonadales bacterium]|nr:hypothetical protein [Xanthomonadales bacterium]
MSARRITATLSALLMLAMLVVIAWPSLRSTFEPPSREGPIGLVTVGDEPALWLMTRQEEERSRHVGGGTRSIGRWVTDHYLHFRLQAHDARDAGRRWLRELRVVKDDIDTHGRQARIFGQQGEVVWVWVCDEVLALDARDGRVLADRVALERINPDLAGLLPRDLQFHAWYGGLVINLVDGRRVRLRSDGFIAEPFTIDDENAFRYATSLSTTWNGFYQTKDFGVRAGTFGGHWIGLFSDAERRDAIDDGFGDHYRNADEVLDENFGARRRFWRAEAGRTREFSEGDHPRIRDLVAIDGAKTYLEGRLLKAPDVPGAARGAFTRIGIWKAAARLPVTFDDGGTLVVYNTRIDAAGRLALARLDRAFREQWTTTLPFKSIGARWSLPGRLLLVGGGDYSRPGMGDVAEAIVALDLATGTWSGWDVAAEAAIERPK